MKGYVRKILNLIELEYKNLRCTDGNVITSVFVERFKGNTIFI